LATEQQLLIQLLSGEHLSSVDKKRLLDYLEQEDTSALHALLLQQFGEDLEAGARIDKAVSAQLWQQIAGKGGLKQVTPAVETIPARRRSLAMPRLWWAAAAVILVLGAGTYLWQASSSHPSNTPSSLVQNIPPGHEGAVLTLADGSQIQLDTVQNAVVALQGGATAKVVNGALIYEESRDQHPIVYNTMSTPKGRQFRLTLPDGSAIWLNSASSIRFPTVFAEAERKVEVTGEAYFEVADDPAKPFRVSINNKAAITVLGTHFNINAYDNEESIATTLLEGKVQVSNLLQSAAGNATVTLQPLQQAQITPAGAGIRLINSVDPERVMAWKNGLFHFENATLAEIMRQLERWYDIEVVYESTVPDIALKGEITRDVPIGDLLTALKKLGVHYKLEGRRLLIAH
jgi:ferric-dicitrate binding protein FerR (iron transport regulator)